MNKPDKSYPTSVSLSPTARKVLTYISYQIPTRPGMSSIIEDILLGNIKMDDFNIPPELQDEVNQELQRRKYER